ncbi:hypothetical protein [Aliiroseovarius sp. 2305UL8-7]|uniref:hypothetical protein n=1 Tax=Aliiroseovarius conchicola TaxID=3121637 RepID=UPI00352844B1
MALRIVSKATNLQKGLVMSKTPRIMLHLTKTAGGTLNTALRSAPNLNVEMVYSVDEEHQLNGQDHGHIDLFYGHMFFGVHERIGLQPTPRYLCFMRHPVTRTISHYYHLRNHDESFIGDIMRKSSDINDFFETTGYWEFSDLMSKVISGKQKHDDKEELFRMAVHNLDNYFDFVGFQEFFALSVRDLNKTLGTKLDIQSNANVGVYSFDEVSEETVQRIESLNAIDLRLYRHALDKFLGAQ